MSNVCYIFFTLFLGILALICFEKVNEKLKSTKLIKVILYIFISLFFMFSAKILNTDLNDINMVVTDEALMEERKTLEVNKKPKKVETTEVWNDAFASVLKSVPIFDYSLNNIKGKKELPVRSNKVEGFPQDKVLYIEIQDNEMSGFRMIKGDLAFAHLVKEPSNNGIFLVDYKGERIIRQLKSLGNSKYLLVSNGGALMTETVTVKEFEVVAKLERIEITL